MKEIMMSTPTHRGGGVCNDTGVCYLGEVNDLITYANLSIHFGVTEGTLMTGTEINKWLHFTLDGKELYVSKVAIRNGISWDQLYSRGLVYGTNDNGRYPTGTPTNQYRTITLNGKLYKCRLLRGADADNIILTSGYDTLTSRNSEWSRIFYPIVTNDPYAKSYTGPKLASYTSGVLNMATGNGNQSWCQERPSNATTSRVLRGYASVANLLWIASSDVARTRGWRPVLELISD